MCTRSALGVAALVIIVIAIAVHFWWRRKRALAEQSSLYNRVGGVFAIAGLVDHFSDAILKDPVVGVDSPNPQLREWSRAQVAARLPGLKFMRTLWVCDVAGGPQRYRATRPGRGRLDLSAAHRGLRITSAEFDAVARILAESLDWAKVPVAEKGEVLAAFAAHKAEVVSA